MKDGKCWVSISESNIFVTNCECLINNSEINKLEIHLYKTGTNLLPNMFFRIHVHFSKLLVFFQHVNTKNERIASTLLFCFIKLCFI